MAPKKKRNVHNRKRRSLDRQQGNRSGKKSILIVCEGEETEPNYFKAWCRQRKLRTVKVNDGTGRTTALQVVKRAQKLKEERAQLANVSEKHSAYEEVWCVLDRESKHENTSFEQAKTVARQNSIKLAVSNPSIEYWYLLHFENTARSFQNAKAVEKELKKYIPEYGKSFPVFARIESSTKTAIERSVRILKNRPDKEDLYPNSSTHVHKIVEQLIN